MADTEIANAANAAPLLGAEIFPVDNAGAAGRCTAWDIFEFILDKGADVASAGTTVLGSGSFFHITGTVTITDIDFTNTWDGRTARLVFDGILTLTHNATSLILPGGQNIKTGAGDSCTVVVDSGDNIKVTQFERASQLQLANPANCSIANQSPAASATTKLTDSTIIIPPYGVAIRSRFLWHVVMSKTGAGTVALVFLVKIGTADTTADGTVLTFTFPAVGTGIADEGECWIEMEIVGPLTSSCVVRGTLSFQHRLTTTGFVTTAGWIRIIGTPATFNATTASLKAHVSITTGASYVITIEAVTAESSNL